MKKNWLKIIGSAAAALYLCIAVDGNFHGADEPVYYHFTASVVEDGDLNISNQMRSAGENFTITAAYDIPVIQNEGATVFWAPFYIAAKIVHSFFSPVAGFFGRSVAFERLASSALSLSTVLLCFLSLALIYRLCLSFGFSSGLSLFSLIAVFFGTPLFYYSLFEPGNANIAALFTAALIIFYLSCPGSTRPGRLFVFGLLCATAAAVKVEIWFYSLAVVPVLAFMSVRRKITPAGILLFLAGFMIVFFLRGVNLYLKFGTIVLSEFVYLSGLSEAHLNYFSSGLFGPYRGVIFTSPIIVLSALGGAVLAVGSAGMRKAANERRFVLICLFAILLIKLFILNRMFMTADCTLAGRILIADTPALVFLLAYFLKAAGKFRAYAAAGVVFMAAWNMLVISRHMTRLDWVFMSGCPDPSSLLLDAGNIAYALFFPKALFEKALFLPVAAVLSAAVWFISIFLARKRKPGPLAEKFWVAVVFYMAAAYLIITSMNVIKGPANADKHKAGGFFANAVIARKGWLDPVEYDRVHIFLDMMRYFAFLGDSSSLSALKSSGAKLYDSEKAGQALAASVKGYNYLADHFRRERMIDRAVGVYRRMTGLYPYDPESYLGLGEMYAMKRDFHQAEECYLKAIALKPEWMQVYLRLGDLYNTFGRTGQAEAVFAKAIEMSGPDRSSVLAVEAMQFLANIYKSSENYDKSAEIYKKLISAVPRNIYNYLDIGDIHEKTGDTDKAVEYYLKAFSLDPGNPEAGSRLGRISYDAGQYDKAVGYYQTVLSRDGSRIEALRGIARSYARKGSAEKAVFYYNRILSINPMEGYVHGELASVYSQSGDLGAALKSMIKAVELYPTAENYFSLGDIYRMSGDKIRALEYFERAFSRSSSELLRVWSLAAIGDIRERDGDHELAARAYERLLSLKAAPADYYLTAGNLYLRTGEFDKAIERFRSYSRARPGSPDPALDLMAQAYERKGDLENAADCLIKYSGSRGYPSVHSRIADLYMRMGRYGEAESHYIKAGRGDLADEMKKMRKR